MSTITGSTSPETLSGGNQGDYITGAPGADTNPGAGGSSDNDSLYGSGGPDTLFGGGGNDTLNAGPGSNSASEYLNGGDGNDYLITQNTTDFVDGGAGSDTVDLTAFDTVGWTHDTLTGAWSHSNNGGTISVTGVDYFQFGSTTLTAPCFNAGTLIATARGEVAVEDLRVGDLVVSPRAAAPLQPVIWVGHSQVNITRHPEAVKVAPILIKASALADGVPNRDLRVSPEHAMFLDGHLVPAKHLVNGSTIVQETWCPEVTYWHVELPTHGLLVAEGAVSESYFDDGNRKSFDNYGITTLFKDFESERHNGRYETQACYPVLNGGERLDRVRARIAARADEVVAKAQRVA